MICSVSRECFSSVIYCYLEWDFIIAVWIQAKRDGVFLKPLRTECWYLS